jgi:cytoskeletal protein CcmA (bactofilin family)
LSLEGSMLGRKKVQKLVPPMVQPNGNSAHPTTLLTVIGETAKVEGKFDIADSIQIVCEVGGELRVGGKLVIGEKGVVNANVETVDAIIIGHYDGNMTATGNVEIAATGRVSGNIKTDSLVISKGGSFTGNVSKIHEDSASGAPPPVYLIEEKWAGQTAPR